MNRSILPDQLHLDLFEVQDDVRDIFFHVGQRHELVERAVDFRCRDGRALQRRQQDTSQTVAQRNTVTALQRLCDKLAVRVRQGVPVDYDIFLDESGHANCDT